MAVVVEKNPDNIELFKMICNLSFEKMAALLPHFAVIQATITNFASLHPGGFTVIVMAALIYSASIHHDHEETARASKHEAEETARAFKHEAEETARKHEETIRACCQSCRFYERILITQAVIILSIAVFVIFRSFRESRKMRPYAAFFAACTHL